MGMPIGKNEQIKLLTADYSRGRMIRAGVVAFVSVGIGSMPLPPAADEWKAWLVGLLAGIAALLTTKKG